MEERKRVILALFFIFVNKVIIKNRVANEARIFQLPGINGGVNKKRIEIIEIVSPRINERILILFKEKLIITKIRARRVKKLAKIKGE